MSGMTAREIAIMHEAFMVGRVYAARGEIESPATINGVLYSKCKRIADSVRKLPRRKGER